MKFDMTKILMTVLSVVLAMYVYDKVIKPMLAS